MRLNLFLQKNSIGALRCVGSVVYSVFCPYKIFYSFLYLSLCASGLDLSVRYPLFGFLELGMSHHHGVLYHEGELGSVRWLFALSLLNTT